MTLKESLKRTPLYPVLHYSRYLAHRYLVERSFRSCFLSDGVEIEPVDNGICFFGYHNISPENVNGDLIYLKVNKEKVRGSMHEAADIMLKSPSGEIREIARTRSWNWQQGCMLQWLNRDGLHILYNDYDVGEDRYVSRVIDTDGNHVRSYNMPVNYVDRKGRYALCLNYDRLAEMRPDYGYFNKSQISLPPDDQDGIWRMDLDTGDIRLIVSLEELKNLNTTPLMSGAEHKVNHIDINPSGTRFLFHHRWIGPQGRFMRLFTSQPDGSDLCMLNGDEMTSHCCWLNDREILSYCEYQSEQAYFRFTDRTDDVQRFFTTLPDSDGHPSVSPDGRWLVTDTYPGLSRMSALYLLDLSGRVIHQAGSFHQPLQYVKEMRVDLHPKWSPDSRSVYFESAHSGKRQLYRMQWKQLQAG